METSPSGKTTPVLYGYLQKTQNGIFRWENDGEMQSLLTLGKFGEEEQLLHPKPHQCLLARADGGGGGGGQIFAVPAVDLKASSTLSP